GNDHQQLNQRKPARRLCSRASLHGGSAHANGGTDDVNRHELTVPLLATLQSIRRSRNSESQGTNQRQPVNGLAAHLCAAACNKMEGLAAKGAKCAKEIQTDNPSVFAPFVKV